MGKAEGRAGICPPVPPSPAGVPPARRLSPPVLSIFASSPRLPVLPLSRFGALKPPTPAEQRETSTTRAPERRGRGGTGEKKGRGGRRGCARGDCRAGEGAGRAKETMNTLKETWRVHVKNNGKRTTEGGERREGKRGRKGGARGWQCDRTGTGQGRQSAFPVHALSCLLLGCLG